MSRLPTNIKGRDLIKTLEKFGFVQTGGKGSHIRLKHPDGRWTQVAVHTKPVPLGTLRAILRQSKLHIEDL
ncbi:MAG: type II toxin-antitoxin system HicA family toxin [Candidatus Amesbacteria bacterium]|nr:type II toxin-antitoxin system HicA family toxin [Candidatus Amesbacteria bacterium]